MLRFSLFFNKDEKTNKLKNGACLIPLAPVHNPGGHFLLFFRMVVFQRVLRLCLGYVDHVTTTGSLGGSIKPPYDGRNRCSGGRDDAFMFRSGLVRPRYCHAHNSCPLLVMMFAHYQSSCSLQALHNPQAKDGNKTPAWLLNHSSLHARRYRSKNRIRRNRLGLRTPV